MANLNLPDTAVAGELDHIIDHNKIVTAISTVNTALEAVETELGANPSGSADTVAARLAAMESGGANKDTEFSPREGLTWAFAEEFTGASLTGTAVNNPSGGAGRIAWTQTNGMLSAALTGGDAAAEQHAMLYPHTIAVGSSLVGAFSAVAKANYVLGGLVVSNGTTYGSGAQVFAAFHNPATNSIRTFTGFNAQVSDVGSATTAQWHGDGPVHYRLKRTASTTWEMSISPDGISWMYWTAATYDIGTPTHVGAMCGTWGGASPGVFTCHYLRVGVV